MDQIIIKDLEVFFSVGVPDEERAKPQRLLITLVLEHDMQRAVAGDDLDATVDYSAVTERVARLGVGKSWRLIERLADDVAGLILSEFGPTRVTVKIKKFILPETRYVAVQISRP